MSRLWECKNAVSPVTGTILLVGMTVIMVSIVALSVFAFGAFEHEIAPVANIMAVEASGDIDKKLYENKIVLVHKGGDSLFENNTEIIITGKGYVYTGSDPQPASAQDIRIVYRDLFGNNYGGEHGNNLGEIVEGTTWDVGEQIELYGKDGRNIGLIMEQGNSVDSKWKLQAGSTASVAIIHRPTNQIIAVSRVTVKNP
ncbi:MAG: type IV pilin N-terminal domain-containing protein [Candidatus Methanoperedens sp.]|nr:type IV pilin N-terminal domain-containing protein [Candidatus Methanoperedens sp.]